MRHLLRRILFYLAAAWAAITVNFFIPRLAPGDPALAFLARIQKARVSGPRRLAGDPRDAGRRYK